MSATVSGIESQAAHAGQVFDGVLRASLLGSVAIMLIFIVRGFAKRSLSPAFRCLLWLPAVVLLLAPRLPDLGFGLKHEMLMPRAKVTQQVEERGDLLVVRTDTPTLLAVGGQPSVAESPKLSLFSKLSLLWVAGAALTLAFWLVNYLVLCVRVALSCSPVPRSLAASAQLCARTMRLRKPPVLKITDAVTTPALMGLLRPAILMPPVFHETLSAEELRMVMLHEMGHVKRRDLIFQWLALLLLAVHWFNPLCWISAWLFRADREAACDAAVLRACKQDSRSLYGHTLLKLQSVRPAGLRLQSLVGVLGSNDMLRKRIIEIAHFGRGSTRVGFATLVIVSLCAASLAILAAEPPPPVPVATEREDGMQTRAYKVPPDFVKILGGALALGADAVSVKELLGARGVGFPEGASAVFSGATSQLFLRDTVENLERVEHIVDATLADIEKKRRQVYITSKLVVFGDEMLGKPIQWFADRPSPPSLTSTNNVPMYVGGTLTDPQFQVVMRALSRVVPNGLQPPLKDVGNSVKAILSLPSVTTRGGQKAVMQVVREYRFPTEYEPGADGADAKPKVFGKRDIGFSMEVVPVIANDAKTIELTIKPTICTYVKAIEFGKGVKQPEFNTSSVSTSLTINDGDTLEIAGESPISNFLLDPNTNQPGVPSPHRSPVVLFITARIIDPSGQPVNASVVKPAPSPPKAPLKKPAASLPKTTAAPPAPPIGIEVSVIHAEVVSKPGDGPAFQWPWDVAVSQLDEQPKKDTAPKSKDKEVPVVDLAKAARLGVLSISGIFTEPQRDEVLKALDQRKGVTLHKFKPEKLPVADGKAVFALSGYKPDRKIVVKPTVGPDGSTVDLQISIPLAISDKGDILTSVTVWDGQSTVLSGLISNDKKGSQTAALFITTKILRAPATK